MIKNRFVFLILFFIALVACRKVETPIISQDELLSTETIQITPTFETRQPTLTAIPTLLPDGWDQADNGEKSKNKEDYEYVDDVYAFSVQPGTPLAITAWTHGCDWMGLAGQVFYDNNRPVENIIVEVGGSLNEQDVLGLSITGLFNAYGPGGYEIQLAEQPIVSLGSLWIQLKDISGLDLSRKYPITTYGDCAQNLTLINFVRSGPNPQTVLYFPHFFK